MVQDLKQVRLDCITVAKFKLSSSIDHFYVILLWPLAQSSAQVKSGYELQAKIGREKVCKLTPF